MQLLPFLYWENPIYDFLDFRTNKRHFSLVKAFLVIMFFTTNSQ